jgi:hypothetical protein
VRGAADPEQIRRLARELGKAVDLGTKMYLTGGATAVLEGWRDSTIDIDVRFDPDSDAALDRIRDLKEELSINVELASPPFRRSSLRVFERPSNHWRRALGSSGPPSNAYPRRFFPFRFPPHRGFISGRRLATLPF